MTSATVATAGLRIRTYRNDDEANVLSLLSASLGAGPAGRRPPPFFRWKHLQNPFGRSYMLVAELDGRVVGFRSFMRWRFRAGDATVLGVRAVDTATHPDVQGQGIFRRLTMTALDDLRSGADLVFNTPNEKSLPGYRKMGWDEVGSVPIRVRVVRPVRFARGIRGRRAPVDGPAPVAVAAPAAREAFADAGEIATLAAANEERFATDRDGAYLRWRYMDAPLLDYRVVRVERAGALRGVAFFRVRPRGSLMEATVADVLTAPGDEATARALLREIRRSAPVDHLTCSFPTGGTAAAAARRSGYVRSPEGMAFVTNPLRDTPLDPRAMASWALTLGDLEVF